MSWPDLSLCQSIDRHIAASGLSPDEIRSAKQQRDLATMMDGLCFDQMLYITGQKIGSQHIHGTWSGLLTHYLEERNDAGTFAFAPSPGPDETHINQFMFIPIIVLHALGTFARYVLTDEEAQVVSGLFQSTEEEIMRIYTEAGEDALAAMIRITITQAAFEAIARTLPLGNVSFENKTDEQGQRLVDRRNRQRLPPLRYHS